MEKQSLYKSLNNLIFEEKEIYQVPMSDDFNSSSTKEELKSSESDA